VFKFAETIHSGRLCFNLDNLSVKNTNPWGLAQVPAGFVKEEN